MQQAEAKRQEEGTTACAFQIGGLDAFAEPCGALVLPKPGLLVVSDLHLEKGAAFARRGQPLPPYDTAATLDRLEAAARRHQPKMIVALGDSFHDLHGESGLDTDDRERLKRLVAATGRFIWISGNHDPEAPQDLGGEAHETLEIDGLSFRHEPTHDPAPGSIELCGHLHPAAVVRMPGASARRPCFAGDHRRLMLPAYGAYAGGLSLSHPAFDGLFSARGFYCIALGRSRAYRVDPRLVAGAPRRR